MKRIHADLLSQTQGLVNIFLLDALDTEVGEGDSHVLTQVDGADSFLAAFLANQIVWVWPVGRVYCDAADDHHRLAGVSDHLDSGEGAGVCGAAGAWDATGAPAFTLVPEPEPLACRLLQHAHVGVLLPAAARLHGTGQ